MKHILNTFVIAISWACLAMPAAYAHEARPVSDQDGYAIVYGDPGHLESYSNDEVQNIRAVDSAGQALKTTRHNTNKGVRFTVVGEPAVLTFVFDRGYWSQTTQGRINAPKSKAKGAIKSYHEVDYNKTVLRFSSASSQSRGQRLEIIPQGSTAPKAKESLQVQVLWNGKPLSGARLENDEYVAQGGSQAFITDKHGKISVPIVAGWQTWEVSHKEPISDDPEADMYSATANLIFKVQ
jgi:nickel transport protein